MSKPESSIIVRTFNEEKHLPRLLAAIQAQEYSDFELIIVDSGSVDRTIAIARDYGHKVISISRHDFTFGYSLNAGIRQSAGEYIVIVSAHTEPVESTWLQALVAPLHDDRTAMVYGRQVGGESSKFSEVQDFCRTFNHTPKVMRGNDFFANNANSAIRKVLWEKYPFDETLPGLEDIDWAKHWVKEGYKVVYEPAAGIYHIHEETWRQIRRRYYREGMAAKWIGVKGRRHIPKELILECRNTASDLAKAAREGCLGRKWREIGRFRFHKSVGTIRGLWDGAILGDPRAKEDLYFDNACEAVVVRGPKKARLEEVRIPPLKPGDVLISVAYVGVCGTDLEIFNGTLGYYKTGLARYPIVPGHEFSGRVVKVGPNVDHLAEGDPVVAQCIMTCGECHHCLNDNPAACSRRQEVGVIGHNGGYCRHTVLPGRFVTKLPADMDLKEACLCEPLAVVLKGIRRLERSCGNRAGIRCAVIGAGPIGHLGAKVLALRGHQVTLFDRLSQRLKPFSGSAIETAEDLNRLGEHEAFIEATGCIEALEATLKKSPPGSTVLLLGFPYARREFDFEGLVASEKTILGSVGSNADNFAEAVDLIPRLDLAPLTGKIVPLSEFEKAWDDCSAKSCLKVLLEVEPTLKHER